VVLEVVLVVMVVMMILLLSLLELLMPVPYELSVIVFVSIP
jgi:hypothetical protein